MNRTKRAAAVGRGDTALLHRALHRCGCMEWARQLVQDGKIVGDSKHISAADCADCVAALRTAIEDNYSEELQAQLSAKPTQRRVPHSLAILLAECQLYFEQAEAGELEEAAACEESDGEPGPGPARSSPASRPRRTAARAHMVEQMRQQPAAPRPLPTAHTTAAQAPQPATLLAAPPLVVVQQPQPAAAASLPRPALPLLLPTPFLPGHLPPGSGAVPNGFVLSGVPGVLAFPGPQFVLQPAFAPHVLPPAWPPPPPGQL